MKEFLRCAENNPTAALQVGIKRARGLRLVKAFSAVFRLPLHVCPPHALNGWLQALGLDL